MKGPRTRGVVMGQLNPTPAEQQTRRLLQHFREYMSQSMPHRIVRVDKGDEAHLEGGVLWDTETPEPKAGIGRYLSS